MKEIWKDAVGYEGLYQISNIGNVMSLHSYGGSKQRLMHPVGNGTGYLKVILCKNRTQKQHLVHRLVAEAFIPNPEKLDFVNHKDENKTNNCVENLEWCTKSYNSIYYLNKDKNRKQEYAKRLRDKETGESLSPMTKRIPRKYTKKVIQKDLSGNVTRVFRNLSEASEETGLSISHITTACLSKKKNGESRKSHGFIWEFSD